MLISGLKGLNSESVSRSRNQKGKQPNTSLSLTSTCSVKCLYVYY